MSESFSLFLQFVSLRCFLGGCGHNAKNVRAHSTKTCYAQSFPFYFHNCNLLHRTWVHQSWSMFLCQSGLSHFLSAKESTKRYGWSKDAAWSVELLKPSLVLCN